MNDHLTRERDPFAARIGLGLRELDGLEHGPDVSGAVRHRLADVAGPPADTPRHRPVSLLLAALLALAVTATLMWQSRAGGGGRDTTAGQTQDPQAVQLVYRTAEAPEAAPRDALLQVLRQRLGALGVATCEGDTVTITVVAGGPVSKVRALLEGQHRFEMRMLADGDYTADDGVLGGAVRFDMAAERAHLQNWLDAGGADRLRDDPDAIRAFAAQSPWLRWRPHLIRPRADRPELWGFRHADAPQLQSSVVFVGAAAAWNGGRVPEQLRDTPEAQRFLVELVAINMHEWHIDADTIDPDGVALAEGRIGLPAVRYALRAAERQRYGDLSEQYIGKAIAILWNEQVLTAPLFMSRIPGVGIIEGLSPELAEDLVRVLRHPLPLPLEFVR